MQRAFEVLLYGMRLNARRWWHFRGSFALDIAASATFAIASTAFWSIIYSNVNPVPNWSLGEIFVLLAWLEVFFAVERGVFGVSGKIWVAINTGTLDKYLARPTSARVLLIAMSLRLEMILRALPSIALLFVLGVTNGATLTPHRVFLGLLICFAAAASYASLQAVGSYLAFWIGRSRVIDELTDQFGMLAQYPITVFPFAMQVVLVTVLPFALASSAPALVSTGGTNPLSALLIAGVTASSWFFMQQIVWKKGTCRYESYGG